MSLHVCVVCVTALNVTEADEAFKTANQASSEMQSDDISSLLRLFCMIGSYSSCAPVHKVLSSKDK